jgi:hypothetical protein
VGAHFFRAIVLFCVKETIRTAISDIVLYFSIEIFCSSQPSQPVLSQKKVYLFPNTAGSCSYQQHLGKTRQRAQLLPVFKSLMTDSTLTPSA